MPGDQGGGSWVRWSDMTDYVGESLKGVYTEIGRNRTAIGEHDRWHRDYGERRRASRASLWVTAVGIVVAAVTSTASLVVMIVVAVKHG